MATRLGPSTIALTFALTLAATSPGRAQAPASGADEVKDTFGLCRVQLRNLASAVRARLDEMEAGADRAAEHRRKIMDQQAVVMKAQRAYEEARLKVEVAEVEVTKYEAGTAKQQLAKIEGDIALARADLKGAEDLMEDAKVRAEEAKTLVERIGQMPKVTIGDLLSEFYAAQSRRSAEAQLLSDKFRIDKAKFSIEQAEVTEEVFLKYTKLIRIKELQAGVEMAKSDMLMKRAELFLAKDVEARLEREAPRADDRALTPAEGKAIAKFTALEPAWRAILARRGEVEKADPSKRDELKKLLGDFARSLDEADGAWSSARESRLDDRAADTMRRVR